MRERVFVLHAMNGLLIVFVVVVVVVVVVLNSTF